MLCIQSRRGTSQNLTLGIFLRASDLGAATTAFLSSEFESGVVSLLRLVLEV